MRESAASVYRERLGTRREALAALERRHVWMSRLRLAIAASGAVILIVGGFAAARWLTIPVLAFVVAAVMHARLLDARRRASHAVAFYERGLSRLAHEWIGRGEHGEPFRRADHPYADDLDIFGRGSLFELLATTRTQAGQQTLAQWLLEPAGPDEVRARQEAVRELAPQLDLRESIAVLGDDVGVGVHAESLRAWATAPVRLAEPGLRVLLAGLAGGVAAVVAFAALTGGVTGWPARMLLALFVFEALAALWLRPRVKPIIDGIDEPTRDLELLSDLLGTIERAPFTSPKLAGIQDALGMHARPASADIASLARLEALLASRRNVMFALPAALLLWGTQLACAVEAWRRRAGRHVPDWLDAIGEFEALVALATFAFEHPEYIFPEIAPADGPHLSATALAHPLLPASAVPNDVAVGNGGSLLLIVSGSNMSGKSTFLRAIGVNVVLAQAGSPVRASALRLSPLAVGAAMRIADSLVEGRSHFLAEILRLKQIVDQARTHHGRLLFLLDEVLGGTNSHDRRHGAEALLVGLAGLGAIGLVTTHDLALGELAGNPAARAANVHFEDQFDEGRLVFDYRLKAGIVKTSNAITLMRSIGLEV